MLVGAGVLASQAFRSDDRLVETERTDGDDPAPGRVGMTRDELLRVLRDTRADHGLAEDVRRLARDTMNELGPIR
ncbi:hypothetical protein [Actinomycetospora sp. CA-084318]|uniref:hypothetical protein n=1 Tax=Actinomycetospora sp. CA-084318 TaxID=3239892 RepID=UPI003D986056